MTRTIIAVLMCLPLAAFTTSCDSDKTKPASSAKPYEVVVVDDSTGIISKALTEPMEALPQAEPQYDAVNISGKEYNGIMRLARTVVIYDKRSRLAVSRNINAQPQLIIRTDGSNPRELRSRLLAFELGSAINQLRRKNNHKASELIAKATGVAMLCPPDMTSSKESAGFAWVSNNSADRMQNIAAFTIKGSPRNLVMAVDSALSHNIPGERDNSCMQLAGQPVAVRNMHLGKRKFTQWRGLWEMRGDAMGGPYVLHFYRIDGKTVGVMAFVYAPATDKRNLTRQIEAALYTIK